jgi:hypothetical protein
MPDTLTPLVHQWENFYLLIGGAAATLVGLMFVAISLGAGQITKQAVPALRTFVSPTLIHFIYILVTASVVLIPTVTRTLVGILLLSVGFISLVLALTRIPFMRQQHREQSIDLHDWAWHLLAPLASYLLFVGTGIGLLRGISGALNGLALASVLLLVAGIRNAWDTVVYLILNRDTPPQQ